jgi:hypothetical protein
MLDGGDAALGDTHARGHLSLRNPESPAHFCQAPGALLCAKLLHPCCNRGLVVRVREDRPHEP